MSMGGLYVGIGILLVESHHPVIGGLLIGTGISRILAFILEALQ